MAQLSINDTVKLKNAVEIPRLGFGVYLSPLDLCTKSCLAALNAGYRHIDTAQYYANEDQVGSAVQQSSLGRSNVFLTSKILSAGGSVEQSYQQCVESIQKLDPVQGYADLYLIHRPNSGKANRLEMWQALERLYLEGKAKAIGVSNFGIRHIEELKEVAQTWPPHVNQFELHPWCQQREIVGYCEKQGIIIEAYSPIVRNKKSKDKTLVAIAQKHSVEPNQVLIRYCLQKGWVPLPKSDDPSRIKTNADVFSFKLDSGDMAELDGLDQGPAGSIVQAVQNQ